MLLLTTVAIESVAQNASESKVLDRKKHRVVMQVTQADSATQLTIIGQIKNIKKALPNAEIEVVCHSQGLPLVIASQTMVAQQIEELVNQNVTFAACENTMKRHKVTKQELLPQVTTVPSGMAEIILKQEAGWTYVKGGL